MFAQAPGQPTSPPTAAAQSLKRFLQTFDDDKTTRYVAAFSDLNGDGKPEASFIYQAKNGVEAVVVTR